MSGSFRVLATMVCMGLATSLTRTNAADLPAPSPPPLPPAPSLPVDYAGGLYVRIDGGVGFNDAPSLSIDPAPVGRATGSLADPNYRGRFTNSGFSRARLSEGKFGDVGVGYRISDFFRADVTGEVRGGSQLTANGTLIDKGTTSTPFGALNVRNAAMIMFKGNVSSAIVLANGYVDLGHYSGFTPFVGAGIGAAHVAVNSLKETGRFTVRVANFAPISAPFQGSLKDGSTAGLAWALTGGVSYDVTPNLKFEVAYRYLDYGQIRSGTETIVAPGGVIAKQPYSGRSRDLVANDVKVGLRWTFNAPPVLTGEPLSRRF